MHVYIILIQSITKISNAKLFTHSTFEFSTLEENNFVNLQLDFQTTSSLKKKEIHTCFSEEGILGKNDCMSLKWNYCLDLTISQCIKISV